MPKPTTRRPSSPTKMLGSRARKMAASDNYRRARTSLGELGPSRRRHHGKSSCRSIYRRARRPRRTRRPAGADPRVDDAARAGLTAGLDD